MRRRLGSALITMSMLVACGSQESSAPPPSKAAAPATPTPPPAPKPAAAPGDPELTPPPYCKPATLEGFQSATGGNEEVRSVTAIAKGLHFDTSAAGVRAVYDCTKGGNPAGWAVRYKAEKPEDKDGMLWWMADAPAGRQSFFAHLSGDHSYFEFKDRVVHLDKRAKTSETTARDTAAKPQT